MIIEDERTNPVVDAEPYYKEGPLVVVDHQIPATWAYFLNMCREVRDPQVHHDLQHDLIEHLWRMKGNQNAGNN